MIHINHYIDHTLLRPDVSTANVVFHCEQAMKYNFYAVCLNSTYIPSAKSILDRTDIKICSTVNFPLGASSMPAVCKEAEVALNDGADEIDTVINVGYLKSGYFDALEKDLSQLRKVTRDSILKVIIETCLLTEEEKRTACKICCEVEVDFIKTSTGFSTAGATLQDIALIKDVIKDHPVRIKAAGGIRTNAQALEYINAGVARLGTSNGPNIMKKESLDIPQSDY